MKVYQTGNCEFIEAETLKEAEQIRNSLTIQLDGYKNKGQVIKLYDELERRFFQTPRYTHVLYDTKHKRMKIERDKFISKKVKIPKLKVKLRDRQIKAKEAYLAHIDDNQIILPPASGKTILSLSIAQALQEKTIILVHRSAFFNVWKKDMKVAFGWTDEDLNKYVGEIQGKKMDIGKYFTLATFQTLYSRDYPIYDEYGLVIADECLVGSTMIDMKDGTKKPIRDIQNGDEVLGGTVSNKFMKVVPKTLKVIAGNRSYQGSLRHPILVVEKEDIMNGITCNYKLKRVMSKDLKIGDKLALRISDKLSLQSNRNSNKGREIFYRGRTPYLLQEVTDLRLIHKPSIVYDFTTTSHTFVANGILSSNCHHCPADTFSTVISKFNAKHIMGVTGTHQRTDGLEILNSLYIGRIAYFEDQSDLNHVEVANIYRVNTNELIPIKRGEHIHSYYHKTLSKRNRFLLFLHLFEQAHKAGRKQLVFLHSKTYAQLYCSILNELGYKTMLVMGRGQGDDTNAVAKELMLAGKLDAIVATVQFLKEGESINNLSTLHMVSPITNKIDWYQATARGQRQFPNKPKVVVFDYVDQLVPRAIRYHQDRYMWSQKNNSHNYASKPIDLENLSMLY